MIQLFNIGFTQRTAEDFFETLKKYRIECLVDIRLNPNGQLSRFAFEKGLPYLLDKLVDGCKYVRRVDLAPSKELLKRVRDRNDPMSKDYGLFEREFRVQLKEHSQICDFVDVFGQYERIALLCSEPTTHKCHRRLVSERLLALFPGQVTYGADL